MHVSTRLRACRFMAPEVLSSRVVPASDMWSAGVMAHQLLVRLGWRPLPEEQLQGPVCSSGGGGVKRWTESTLPKKFAWFLTERTSQLHRIRVRGVTYG